MSGAERPKEQVDPSKLIASNRIRFSLAILILVGLLDRPGAHLEKVRRKWGEEQFGVESALAKLSQARDKIIFDSRFNGTHAA